MAVEVVTKVKRCTDVHGYQKHLNKHSTVQPPILLEATRDADAADMLSAFLTARPDDLHCRGDNSAICMAQKEMDQEEGEACTA